MLGFILVLDTPWFAQTDKQGKTRLQFDAAAGQTCWIKTTRRAPPTGVYRNTQAKPAQP
ncbi:MAG TPA: hypothetical protein VFE95_03400 [Pseudomonas sp.]|jgi:hypothetical protein|nr:hypothetical protein [Pseudomonas sp.]